jgi:hypothetical protein
MLRRLTSRYTPPVSEPPGIIDQLGVLLRVEMLPFWLFWENLRALRPWWPLVLPLLVWYSLRAYRRERAELHRKAAAGR